MANDEPLQLNLVLEEGSEEEANRLIEERMLDIAQILGISVDDRISELRAYIREMILQEEEKRTVRGSKIWKEA